MPPQPYSLLHLEVTDSTQDDARAAFDGSPVLVVARAQRRGRGRSSSMWESAPRAVAASLAVRPGWEQVHLPLISLVAGVAIGRVIDCGLKWPNDVIVGGGKAGGILVEAREGVVVVGMGLNLWWSGPPPGVAALHVADPGPEEGPRLAGAWAGELLELIDLGPDSWPRDEYRSRSVTIGRDITWSPDGAGRAVDVAPDGALVVQVGAETTMLHAGEVRHVRDGA